ncbi:septal ring lytic transglycosylase RlpA family protein [Fulvivirgaceae bacterium BMA12]|uniref:Probable endolytic peptidoglycan transglycosylase RlpA n=1 Tax=Agaribacillus aureus TaxID=3051825 RepID=A0ABT8L8K0_9BACT|nr:septal ring lytic transglycosylase RlpA family protein [Fulvivirgaceae bacterium BMA12]
MPKIMAIVLLITAIFCNICTTQESKTQKGMASYYHNNLHGRATASGELYDKNKLSAAHRSLPFGSKVKVTNLTNQKSVVVIINDRGPYAKKRIIDISYAAAKKIDMIRAGVIEVQLEILKTHEH